MLSEALRGRAFTLAREQAAPVCHGRVVALGPQLIEAELAECRVGDLVRIEDGIGRAVDGEVVGFRDGRVLIVPLGDVRGLSSRALVRRLDGGASLLVSDALLGRVIDVFGAPIDGAGQIIGMKEGAPGVVRAALEAQAPPVAQRSRVVDPMETGIRVIDGLLPLGRGQRVGIFAGAGVGKTSLIRQIAAQSTADIVVFGLIGERGCEVKEILANDVSARSVVVAATSDRSPMERIRGGKVATAIAEAYRARGAHVLLIVDSLTRYAMALREVGLAAGEPPATKGYPPSVFAAMPRLLERVAPQGASTEGGSITGIYTVLVEGDDLSDPVADSARSLLDGHIVLSRDLAARGHFPAVDALGSASRVARQVSTPRAQELQQRVRLELARRKEVEELRSLGAYVPGASPANDRSLELGRALDEWLRQGPEDRSSADDALSALEKIVGAASERK